MNISRKALLTLVVLSGLLAFSAGMNFGVFAEETPDTGKTPIVIKREMGSIWAYNTTCKETAEAVTTTDGKSATYKWETEKTESTMIYFGDYDTKTDKWDILKSSRETSKLLKSYTSGDKDLKAEKEPYYRMFDGPSMYAGPAGFLGKIEYAGPLGDKEWDNAVLNHLPMLREPSYKSGDKGTGKVVVEGKEVGEYSYGVGGLWIDTEMGGKVRNDYLRGTLTAKRDDGRAIEISSYAEKWVEGGSVPEMMSWKMQIEYTKDNTKYSITREYECLTRGAQGAESDAYMLNSLDITRMSAQLKVFKVGYEALQKSNLTVEALQNKTINKDKVIEAGTKYFEAYRQWPAGPFAEHILLWAENINLIAAGSIMRAEVGKAAPPVQVSKWYNTKSISAADYAGKVVIVERFFPNCGPCRQTAPHLAALHNKYSAQGLMVVGLTKYEYSSEQNAQGYTIEDMVSKFGATYPIAADAPTFVLFDKDGNLMKIDRKYVMVERSTTNYPTSSFPHAFVIDRKGTVRWVGHPAKIDAAMIEGLLKEQP